MNTRLIMTINAVLMAFTGIVFSFLPQEIMAYFHLKGNTNYVLVLQVMGALYFSFGMINWTARANLIGGIYGRPIAIGNLTHFTIGALALVKAYFAAYETTILLPAIVYSLFAVVFAMIFFRHPISGTK